ncbi:PAS domain S-box protein [Aquincola sp. S2]|uniref:histidine kinase n=1 Tax=Pseudaquabacterium terrae TaxID=2732868 RepID=A0ABX2ES35_9BURK|nr:ATP-binding protein [Aquabacterium terrae]NRF71448.1 PAS domain S-box protein [Aquabacterium terrae]
MPSDTLAVHAAQPLAGTDIVAFTLGMIALMQAVLWWREREPGMLWLAAAFTLNVVLSHFDSALLPTGSGPNKTYLLINYAVHGCYAFGLVSFLGVAAAWRPRVLALCLAPLAGAGAAVLAGIALPRLLSILPMIWAGVCFFGLCLWAMRREPRAGHGFLVIGAAVGPVYVVWMGAVGADPFLIRYYGWPAVISFGIVLLVVGLTRRQRALRDSERRAVRARDFYEALSRTMHASARAGDAEALYREVCTICVDTARASLAWIGEARGGRLWPVAWAGPGDAYLKDFSLSLDPASPDAVGPIPIAMLSGEPFIANDLLVALAPTPWQQRARRFQMRAAAFFPLRRGGAAVGVLCVYVPEAGFFDDSLVRLLGEMATEISSALDGLERETARVAAVRAAEVGHEHFRRVFNAAPVSVSIATVAGSYLRAVNDTCCARYGYTRDELLGRQMNQLGIGMSAEDRERGLALLAERGVIHNQLVVVRVRSGALRHVLMNAEPIEFEGEACVLNVNVDITERLHAEQALREREQQLAGIVDGAMDAIISVDEQQQVLLFNRAAALLFGLPAEAAIGAPLSRFLVEPLPPAPDSGAARFTLQARDAAGATFPVEASVAHRVQDDRRLATVMLRDLRQQREAEAARRAQQEAETANRAKTDFLSRMSHELRTPLNAVLGFSQLLQASAADRLDDVERHQLDLVFLAAAQLRALIDDVLDLSRVEAGRLAIVLKDAKVDDLLEGVLRMSSLAAQQRQVRLVADTTDAPPRLRTDPIRLRQVLLNLVSNGIKYNRSGGTVRIGVRRGEHRVHIEVADDGLGMSPRQLAGLFEPFNRLGREHGQIEGSGIGLALTRQLIQLMGGEIDVTSREGEGTTVRVSLPWEPPAPARAEHERAWHPTEAGALPGDAAARQATGNDAEPAGVVLYIEDNAVNALLVEQLLKRWPRVSVAHAADGASGLERARALQPDLVLLDMHLPDLDGAEVLGRLRADDSTRALTVIALSASAMPEEQAAARAAGAVAYWTKPLDFAQFLSCIGQLLQPQHAPLDA